MKKLLQIVGGVLIVCITLVLICYFVELIKCNWDQQLISKTGKYTVDIQNQSRSYLPFKEFSFVIYNNDLGKKIYDSAVNGLCGGNMYRAANVLWDEKEDTLWIISGDVGLFAINCKEDGYTEFWWKGSGKERKEVLFCVRDKDGKAVEEMDEIVTKNEDDIPSVVLEHIHGY